MVVRNLGGPELTKRLTALCQDSGGGRERLAAVREFLQELAEPVAAGPPRQRSNPEPSDSPGLPYTDRYGHRRSMPASACPPMLVSACLPAAA